MPKDSFCIQYTNCTGCPNVNENILVYRNLPKGAHIPKDKCTQNCMLFMIKGELLINSEEYPGNILREKQFILQAIGSKIELLALTDVEYIVYWFNELPLLCEERYREITEQAEAPLTYTPLCNKEDLLFIHHTLFYCMNRLFTAHIKMCDHPRKDDHSAKCHRRHFHRFIIQPVFPLSFQVHVLRSQAVHPPSLL